MIPYVFPFPTSTTRKKNLRGIALLHGADCDPKNKRAAARSSKLLHDLIPLGKMNHRRRRKLATDERFPPEESWTLSRRQDPRATSA